VVAFRQGLRELGWTEGHNLQMDYRYGTGEPDRARIFVTELLSLAPDVIVAHGTPALTALHREMHTAPVVFVSVIDPVCSKRSRRVSGGWRAFWTPVSGDLL